MAFIYWVSRESHAYHFVPYVSKLFVRIGVISFIRFIRSSWICSWAKIIANCSLCVYDASIEHIPCSGMYASCGWGQQDKRPRIVNSDTKKGAFFKEIVMSAFARFTNARITILYSVHNISSALAGTWCCTPSWILVVLMLYFHYQVRPDVPYLNFPLINSFRNIRLDLRVYRCENQAKMVPRWSLYVVPQSYRVSVADDIQYRLSWLGLL